MRVYKILLVLTLAMFVELASAAVISVGTHVTPYAFNDRDTVFDQNIESESSAVTKAGSYSNYNVDTGATRWGSRTWLFSGYVEMAFSVLADTLFIQFQADANDGIAEFVVDGLSVGTLNTFNRGWVQVEISGLTLAAHTLRVNRVTRDLAFDNFGAKNNSTVPEPTTLALIGLGLAGIGYRRRRNKKAV